MQKQIKFKVGDRVKVVNFFTSSKQFDEVIGNVGKIEYINVKSTYPITVKFPFYIKGINRFDFLKNELQLISTDKEKICKKNLKLATMLK